MNSSIFNIAIRFFKKDRLFTLINLFGLSTAISCVYFIALFVTDEMSYDNYHKDNIYRIALERHFPNGQRSYAATPMTLGYTMQLEYPEVEMASRAFQLQDFRIENETNEKIFIEDEILAVDSNFLELLSVPIIAGEISALDQPYTLALTDEMALKYFGHEPALGKKLVVNDTIEYTVGAVLDNYNDRSHLEFDFLMSWNSFPFDENSSTVWVAYNTYNYVQLSEDTGYTNFTDQFQNIVIKYIGPPVEAYLGKTIEEYEAAGNLHKFFFQPIDDIHLTSNLQFEMQPNGDIQYVYLFSIIGMFIMAIAAINFTNLSTARSVKRAKEVGIRKTLGSTKKELFLQFFLESTAICTIAGVLGIVIFIFLLPEFNELAGKNLLLGQLNWFIYGPLFLFVIAVISIISGSYPALFMSSFNVVKILKGQVTKGKSNHILRNMLIITQFAISIFLIIGTLVVTEQVKFLIGKRLGYDKEQILTIDNANQLGTSFQSFKNELVNISGIELVSSSFQIPGRQVIGATFEAIGRPSTERHQSGNILSDKDFVNTFGLEVIQGRNFDINRNDSLKVLINETAVAEVGWEDPIGQRIRQSNGVEMEIIGVIKDFHFSSLHEKIRPLIVQNYDLDNLENQQIFPSNISVRLRKNADVNSVIAGMDNLWDRYVTSEKLSSVFLDDEYKQLYNSETKFGNIFLVFAVLAITIAIIGLIGLSSFYAVQKTREIGIRKVLGASLNNLIYIMTKDFIKLLIVANLISWPIAYFVLNSWLSNYPYDITITFEFFLIAGAASIILVLLATGYQSIKSALVNPVKSIRTE
ncbi:MAG: FtsX-like permease family protein [Fulvivirga sp.]|uniref:ABC transporter permease n=1 Tax=Fulvivirga sp. TaxID=1931237 RepID=UPI0032EC2CAE